MQTHPDNQFKKVLIAILIIFSGTIIYTLKPDFEIFKKDEALKLSSDKPWVENFDEFEENNQIDDIKINVTYNNPFKKVEEQEIKDNSAVKSEQNKQKQPDYDDGLDINFLSQNIDEFWVTGSIPLNPMSEYNGKTKKEIYKLRKDYVEKSIFKNRNYTPSDEVFGKIADKKPWLGIEAVTCKGKGQNANKGLSEESRYINNPTVLIGLDRLNFDEKPQAQCSPIDYLQPIKINYSKDENTIKVIFEVSEYKGTLGRNFLLKGLNARDLGFDYSFADNTQNIVFIEKNNISTDIYKFKDSIQLGTACGVKGGCNNAVPYQKELSYAVIKYPASIHFKLWKKKPKNTKTKSDINFLIILR